MNENGRGFKSVSDERTYKSYGGYFFENKDKEYLYNLKMKYKFEKESNRILREMRKSK